MARPYIYRHLENGYMKLAISQTAHHLKSTEIKTKVIKEQSLY